MRLDRARPLDCATVERARAVVAERTNRPKPRYWAVLRDWAEQARFSGGASTASGLFALGVAATAGKVLSKGTRRGFVAGLLGLGASAAVSHVALADGMGLVPKLPLTAGGTGVSSAEEARGVIAKTFSSVARAVLQDLTGETDVILTRRAVGDRIKPSLYAKTAAQPAHEMWFADRVGNIFEYAETEIHVYAAGVRGDFSVNDTAALQRALNVAVARGKGVVNASGILAITSDTLTLYGDKIVFLLHGSEIVKQGTTGDIIKVGFADPAATAFRHGCHVVGGTVTCGDAGVTSGAGINFDKCSTGSIGTKTYGCFVGYWFGSCISVDIFVPATDSGPNWGGVKPGSAGMVITASPGAAIDRCSAIRVFGGSLGANEAHKDYECSLRIEAADGARFIGTYLSWSKFCVTLSPYASTSFLSLIEFSECGFDSPSECHLNMEFSPGYAGVYGANSISGGYIFNAKNFGRIGLSSSNSNFGSRLWSIKVPKCFLSQSDGFVFSSGAGYEIDCSFYNMGGNCIRLQNVKRVDVSAIYDRMPGDAQRGFNLIKIEGTSDNVNVRAWRYGNDVDYIAAITRDASCGPSMTIAEGQSSELSSLTTSAGILSIPAALRSITIYGTETLTGIDAASSWKGRKFTAYIQDGRSLTSGGSFVLKGGSRTAVAGTVLSMWCLDGTRWIET